MRPSHWTKNLFVFAALVFGGKLAGVSGQVAVAAASAFGGFVCFCLAASAVYIFNDIMDRRSDLLHPSKAARPIAAGLVSVPQAAVFAAFCAAVALAGARQLAPSFAAVVAAYMALMVLYSVLFKKMIIVDCIVISIGFCLRAVGGAIVVGVSASPWLIICTFALCLFLGFGKRRSEIVQLGPSGDAFRETLGGYSGELTSHMLNVSSGLAVVCFLLYSTDDRTVGMFGTHNLVYTVPLVMYCVFRCSAIVEKGRYAGPVQLVLRDRPFQAGFVLWALACTAVIYADKLTVSFGNFWAY
jgi:4-hydroxybenzoate polyprenyltransferase